MSTTIKALSVLAILAASAAGNIASASSNFGATGTVAKIGVNSPPVLCKDVRNPTLPDKCGGTQ